MANPLINSGDAVLVVYRKQNIVMFIRQKNKNIVQNVTKYTNK